MAHKFNVFSGLDKRYKDNKSKEPRHETGHITSDEIKNIVSREVNAASAKNQMMNYFDSIAASSERTETMLVELRDVLDAGLARIDAAADRNDNAGKLEQIDASVKRVLEFSESLEDIDASVKRVLELSESLEDIDASVKRVSEMSENLSDIDASVKKAASISESLEQVDQSVKRFEIMHEGLETTLHKDNLISYKNLKDAIDAIENNADKRHGRLRNGIIAAIAVNGLTLILVIIMFLINWGIL